MKKVLTLLFAIAILLFVSDNASAQSIVSDTTRNDGTRIVNVKPEGVCSVNIEIHIRRNRITYLHFTRGCDGNAKGIAALVEGMKVKDVIQKLEGITCGKKSTSCPDQLARALRMISEKKP
ncbi:MAG: TIGR03905 family TSCPD domain-containing protein [Bacteroidales bacterium]|nr:TIGR03905 family TSCPD domain-containing protein [Bacteroidales bacterium]